MPAPAVKAPVFRFRFRNPSNTGMNLWIEPLGEQVKIPPRTTVEVHCTEQRGHPSEFEMSEDGITVHGWVQSVFAVKKTGSLQALWSLPEE
jgi:hypothetical protein